MADLRASGLGGIPKGETEDRPSSPSIGDVFYNGTLGCLEIYTATGWYASSAPMAIPTIGTATDFGSGRSYSSTGAAATITFTQGTGGGLPNTFTATSNPGNITGANSSSPITLTGLTPGTSYTFSVVGTNNFGTSASTAASNSIVATTKPEAPTIGVASEGNGQVSVAFTPGNTGGLTTTYSVISNPGNIITTGSSSPINATGLTNGTAYTFTATATNANGTSAASSASNSVTPISETTVSYLVVAGGGSGGGWNSMPTVSTGGGGGAGGYRSGTLVLTLGASNTVTVGGGGAAPSGATGTNGINSVFASITSTGGGKGGDSTSIGSGGSGGGGASDSTYRTPGGTASPAGQGNAGGVGANSGEFFAAGGGGGAGAVGSNGSTSGATGGNGGAGSVWSVTGITYAGGGAGATRNASGSSNIQGIGGAGGGGNGGFEQGTRSGIAGTANLGGGGGGGHFAGGNGAAGGSGVVIIQSTRQAATTSGSPVITGSGPYLYKFNNSGSITF